MNAIEARACARCGSDVLPDPDTRYPSHFRRRYCSKACAFPANREHIERMHTIRRARLKDTFAARFWARLAPPRADTGCRDWTGQRNDEGYGSITVNNRAEKAHRVAWMLANEATSVPAGMVVMHACDRPPCCEPAHLRAASQSENVRDSVRKGRWVRRGVTGEQNHGVKLRDADVVAIREAWAAKTATQGELAKRYGVSQGHISHIVNHHIRRQA